MSTLYVRKVSHSILASAQILTRGRRNAAGCFHNPSCFAERERERERERKTERERERGRERDRGKGELGIIKGLITLAICPTQGSGIYFEIFDFCRELKCIPCEKLRTSKFRVSAIVGRRSELRGGPYPFGQKSGTPLPFQFFLL
jgi:hypothetical protein